MISETESPEQSILTAHECRKAFRAQSLLKVFSTESIDTVSGKFCPALIDKESVSIEGFWCYAVCGDIAFDECCGFRPECDLAEAISLAQDSQGFVVWVEVVEVQGGYFTGSGA